MVFGIGKPECFLIKLVSPIPRTVILCMTDSITASCLLPSHYTISQVIVLYFNFKLSPNFPFLQSFLPSSSSAILSSLTYDFPKLSTATLPSTHPTSHSQTIYALRITSYLFSLSHTQTFIVDACPDLVSTIYSSFSLAPSSPSRRTY
jgi:hypothetical protein